MNLCESALSYHLSLLSEAKNPRIVLILDSANTAMLP
jgi:hypothetical protein